MLRKEEAAKLNTYKAGAENKDYEFGQRGFISHSIVH